MRTACLIVLILAILQSLVATASVVTAIRDGTIYGHVYNATTGDPVSPGFMRCQG